MAKTEPKKKIAKPDTQRYVGTSDIYYQMMGELLNPSELNSTTIYQMLQRDETIQSALGFVINSVMGAIGDYQNPDAKIAELVTDSVNRTVTSFDTVLNRMLKDMLAYGYSIAEIVWVVEDNRVLVGDLIPLQPAFCSFKAQDGQITAVVYINSQGNKKEIPIQKCLVFRRGSGVYGESVLRSVYAAYSFKSVLKKWWAVAMERYSIPVLGIKTSQPEAAHDSIGQWYSKAQFVMPTDSDIQVITPAGDMAASFRDTIEYQNMLIFRGMFVPQLLGSIQNVGTYALGRVHLEMFNNNVMNIAQELTQQFIDGLIVKLIEYNFGPVEDYGMYQVSINPTVEDMKTMSEVLSTLNQVGIVDPLEAWQRDWFKIIPESEVPLQPKEPQDAE
mgnify:CR=1 FL=1